MKFVSTFYFIVMFFSCSFAQEPGFKLYTSKNGLVGNQVLGIKQDSKGFLWLAMTNGVSRFDGLKFKNFTKNNYLTNSFIRDIDFIGDTTFVIGVNVIDIIINDTVINYFKGNNVRIVKFLHIDGRLYVYCEKTDNKKPLLLDVAKRNYTNDYNDILNEGKNEKLFLTKTNTYKIINDKIFQFCKNNAWKSPIIINLPKYDIVKNFSIDNNGITYITTTKSISSQVVDKLIVLDRYGGIKKSYDLSAFDNLNEICLVLPVTDKLIILPDSRGYIYVLNENKTYKINFNLYICNKIILDNDANVWVASDRGLVKLFCKGFLNFPTSGGYPNDVWGIFPEDKDKIWFSSYSSGLHCYKNGKLIKTVNKFEEQNLMPYLSPVKGFNNDLIIPESKGVIAYNIQTHSFRLVNSPEGKSCLFAKIDTINHKILAGFMTDFYFINKDYSLDSLCSTKNFGSSHVILSATRRNNNYYLACSGDILEFNPTTKKGKWFNLKNIRFNSITTDYQNNLWAASDEGIYFFSKKDTLRYYNNENFMALIIDKNNYLYAVNMNGLYRLNLASYYDNNKNAKFEFYGEDEGFSGAGQQNAFFIDNDGNPWIPGEENSVKIIPSQLEVKETVLKPLIEEVLASDNSKRLFSLIKYNSNTLNYYYKNIHFSFLSVCLSSPEKVKYQYRLIGYNDTWSESFDKREASYTNLLPGDYIFELRASCNNNFDMSVVTKFQFTITPPFWQTWWFYTTFIIAIIIIIIIIIRWQLRKIKKKALLKQKITQLEMELLHMQIEPHFVGNSLEVVKNFINNNLMKKAITAIDSFGNLLRYVAETTRKNQVPLETEFKMLRNYIEFQKLICSDSFDFTISIANEIDVSEISIPPLLIQPFVENAIIHGLKYKNGKGIIQINVKQENNKFISIIVADNGVGRMNSKKYNPDGKEHKSLGIENAQERLKIFNKSNIENIKFIDKTDGTEVIIILRI